MRLMISRFMFPRLKGSVLENVLFFFFSFSFSILSGFYGFKSLWIADCCNVTEEVKEAIASFIHGNLNLKFYIWFEFYKLSNRMCKCFLW